MTLELQQLSLHMEDVQNNATQLWHLLGSLLAVVPVDTTAPSEISERLGGQDVFQQSGWGQVIKWQLIKLKQ